MKIATLNVAPRSYTGDARARWSKRRPAGRRPPGRAVDRNPLEASIPRGPGRVWCYAVVGTSSMRNALMVETSPPVRNHRRKPRSAVGRSLAPTTF